MHWNEIKRIIIRSLCDLIISNQERVQMIKVISTRPMIIFYEEYTQMDLQLLLIKHEIGLRLLMSKYNQRKNRWKSQYLML